MDRYLTHRDLDGRRALETVLPAVSGAAIVADGVLEARLAVEVLSGREGDAAVIVEHGRAVLGVGTASMCSSWPLSLAGPAESLARRSAAGIVTGVSSGVVAVSSSATGSSLTALTVMVTVTMLLSAVPSLALYLKDRCR